MDKIEELKMELLELSKKQAVLNFKIYELFQENRTLAIRLAGYIAENKLFGGNWNDEEVKKIMDKYLLKRR
ncbi:hypothetical protein [Pyrococcus horikoshii]|uniref:Uncharacterized protein n=1 Tax=Pyrococcus horikoshii TaxID=53953 RepID=A0A832T5Y1_PYRHR|nr:hypothetical protein [Pyrococcus horikoshii]HII61051.1 hypothetical protein [Pyrococcus horikoshii]